MTRSLTIAVLVSIVLLSSSMVAFRIPEAAAAEVAVPDQDILLDPFRPIIYWAGGNGDDLRFVDSATGDIVDSISLGGNPSSICLNSDGSILYIAIPSSNCVLEVNVTSHSITANNSVTFSPGSIKLDGGNYMYASGAGAFASSLFSVDVRTWKVKNSVEPGLSNMYVEVSPDGLTLLAFQPGSIPLRICKYSIGSGSFTYLGADDHDLGSALESEVVDWARGIIWIAAGDPYGIEIVSVNTLDEMTMYPMSAFPTCVAMSADGRFVYGVHEDTNSVGVLWMFNAADGSLLGTIAVGPSVYNLAISHDLRSAFVGAPLRRIDLTPKIEPVYPAAGDVLGYTPSYIEMRLGDGLGPYDGQNIDATLDSTSLTLFYHDYDPWWNYYTADSNNTLADGVHYLNISVPWLGQSVWHNNTFTIDRGSPLAVKPGLNPYTPLSGSVQQNTSLSIAAWVVYTNLDWTAQGGWIYVDDLNLSTTFNPQMLSAMYDHPSLGWHNISACVYWDDGLGKAWANWSFLVMQGPALAPLFPTVNQVLTELPDHIEVAVDVGDTEGNVLAPQIYLDELPVLTSMTENGTMRGEIDSIISSGEHRARATLNWAGGKATITWDFDLDMFVGPRKELLVPHQYKDEFRILVPNGSTWTLQEDAEISGAVYPIVMHGPTVGSFLTNIIIESGPDKNVKETESYLDNQLDIALNDVRDSGIDINLLWAPQMRSVDNHTALVATTELVGYGVYQEFAIIASEEHEMIWVIILSISSAEFYPYAEMFDEMLASFEILAEPASGMSGLEQAAIGIVVAAVVGGSCGAVIWLMRNRRKDRA